MMVRLGSQPFLCRLTVIASLMVANPATTSGATEEEPVLVDPDELVTAIVKYWTIQHGGFRWFRTGQTREAALDALKRLAISSFTLRPDRRALAEHPEEVERLRHARAITVDSFLFVEFDGDKIERFGVMPVKIPSAAERAEARSVLEDREDVFEFLRSYLADYPGSQAYESMTAMVRVWTDNATATKIHSYPGWALHFEDGEGFWVVVLWFEGDKLEEIEIQFSPIELP